MLTAQQKRRLQEIKNPALYLQRLLTERAIAEAFQKIEMMKGEAGKTPTKEELIELIKSLIPEPVPGADGDDYVLTEKDKKEIAGKIKVPVVERVVEKREVVIKQPIEYVRVVENIKEVAVPDTAEETRDKLESLKKGKKLSIQAIEDLAEIIEELRKMKKEVETGASPVGGGGGFTSPVYTFIDDETPAGTKDFSNTVFTTHYLPYQGSLKVYKNGARQRVNEDYILSGKNITFTSPPESTDILLVDYRIV